jgi:hypothetical protein
MRLTILTPVIRPAGALAAAQSVQAADASPWHLEHRLCYWPGAPDRTWSQFGAWLTRIIATTATGWLLFVDDDNRLHPHLPARLWALTQARPSARAVVFASAYPELGGVLPGTLPPTPGRIDGGQVALHTNLARMAAWPNSPTGDGEYLAALYALAPDAWLRVDDALTYHNHQEWA